MSGVRWTLDQPARLTQEIRKSRFVANAAPVNTPAAALDWLARVADVQATHNCWAYRIGAQYRFSDDGEPGGTAGRPILQAIEGQGFDQVIVVITRWFGGTKLGAGGLVRAYGGCAAECLRLAPRLPLIEQAEVDFALPLTHLGALRSRAAGWDAQWLAEHFDGDGARLHLRLPRVYVEALRRLLADLTRGRSQLQVRDE